MYSTYGNYGSSSSLNDVLNTASKTASKANSIASWTAFAALAALIGGIVLYFTYLNKKNEGKYTGFLGWMYDFLTFKKMVVEEILRIGYLIVALFITLSSFAYISVSVWAFLGWLVFGNLLIRLIYELSLVVLILCRNTTEINKKMSAKTVETPKKEETPNE